MKPRNLRTIKILAVALTATTGCASTGGVAPVATAEPTNFAPAVAVPVESAPAQADAPQAAEPANAIANANAAAVQPASAPVADLDEEPRDPKLNTLMWELVSKGRAHVMAQPAKFRPLCDKDGYPLVGNVYRKGPSPEIQPSAFCAEIRTRGGAH